MDIQAAIWSGLDRVPLVGDVKVFLALVEGLGGGSLVVERLGCDSFEAAWGTGAFSLRILYYGHVIFLFYKFIAGSRLRNLHADIRVLLSNSKWEKVLNDFYLWL